MCELFDQYWRKGYIQGYTITGKCYNVAYENILQGIKYIKGRSRRTDEALLVKRY